MMNKGVPADKPPSGACCKCRSLRLLSEFRSLCSRTSLHLSATPPNTVLPCAAFVMVLLSFFAEWTSPEKFSFVSYYYFLMAVYAARCYLFGVLILGLLAFCKKSVSMLAEFFALSPAIVGAIILLLGFPFNAMMMYSRVVTVLQVIIATILFAKSLASIPARAAGATSAPQGIGEAAPQSPPTAADIVEASDKLSKREKDVALLLLQGKTTLEIAESLFISAATVKSHIQSIFKKHNVRNRMEFAAVLRNERNIE